MKILCIGRNYAEHAKELSNPLPSKPMFFLKPDTAILRDLQLHGLRHSLRQHLHLIAGIRRRRRSRREIRNSKKRENQKGPEHRQQ